MEPTLALCLAEIQVQRNAIGWLLWCTWDAIRMRLVWYLIWYLRCNWDGFEMLLECNWNLVEILLNLLRSNPWEWYKEFAMVYFRDWTYISSQRNFYALLEGISKESLSKIGHYICWDPLIYPLIYLIKDRQKRLIERMRVVPQIEDFLLPVDKCIQS